MCIRECLCSWPANYSAVWVPIWLILGWMFRVGHCYHATRWHPDLPPWEATWLKKGTFSQLSVGQFGLYLNGCFGSVIATLTPVGAPEEYRLQHQEGQTPKIMVTVKLGTWLLRFRVREIWILNLKVPKYDLHLILPILLCSKRGKFHKNLILLLWIWRTDEY